MKRLKSHFNKNGLDYTLINRNEKVALFQLGPTEYPDGYEVCRIYHMKEHEAFGVVFEESEKISSNDQFITDGSGSFKSLDGALRLFDKLTAQLVRPTNVLSESSSDSELIPECQAV